MEASFFAMKDERVGNAHLKFLVIFEVLVELPIYGGEEN